MCDSALFCADALREVEDRHGIRLSRALFDGAHSLPRVSEVRLLSQRSLCSHLLCCFCLNWLARAQEQCVGVARVLLRLLAHRNAPVQTTELYRALCATAYPAAVIERVVTHLANCGVVLRPRTLSDDSISLAAPAMRAAAKRFAERLGVLMRV